MISRDKVGLVGRLAKTVLHIYEEKFPKDMRVRDCIDATQRYERGELAEIDLEDYRNNAFEAAIEASNINAFSHENVAVAAARATNPDEVRSVLEDVVASVHIRYGEKASENYRNRLRNIIRNKIERM